MLLQLSHFSPFIPLHPVPPSHPHSPPLSSCPWVVHITSLASTVLILFLTCPPIYFVPIIYATYSLYPSPYFPVPSPLITLHVISTLKLVLKLNRVYFDLHRFGLGGGGEGGGSLL